MALVGNRVDIFSSRLAAATAQRDQLAAAAAAAVSGWLPASAAGWLGNCKVASMLWGHCVRRIGTMHPASAAPRLPPTELQKLKEANAVVHFVATGTDTGLG